MRSGEGGCLCVSYQLWGFYPLKKGYCTPTRCQEWSKQLGMEPKNKTDGVPLFRAPPATELVFEGKDRKVPITPEVKEAPKSTCHLHFLLSPVLMNIVQSVISTPGGQLSAPWGSPSFQI